MPNLRERRRLLTVDTIRQAATDLVLVHGLENTTTEMIAEASGISLRTFFNYFSFKEEALIPPRLGFSPEAVQNFVDGTGPILADLLVLLSFHFVKIQADRHHIRNILSLARQHPRMLAVKERTIGQHEEEICALLGQRLGLAATDEAPILIAAVVNAAFRVTMRRWIACDDSDFGVELRRSFQALPRLFDDR